jgi:hypothetical protein
MYKIRIGQRDSNRCLYGIFISILLSIMKRIGIYKIETSFDITGIGIVAIAQQIEGWAKPGSHTHLDIDGVKVPVKIIGVEWGKPGEDDIVRYGLAFSFPDEPLKEKVAKEKLKEQTIEIYYQGEE